MVGECRVMMRLSPPLAGPDDRAEAYGPDHQMTMAAVLNLAVCVEERPDIQLRERVDLILHVARWRAE